MKPISQSSICFLESHVSDYDDTKTRIVSIFSAVICLCNDSHVLSACMCECLSGQRRRNSNEA